MRSRLDIGGLPAHAGSGVLPPSLSYFPTDSAFIKRAARFSSFNGGNFSGMVNSFSASESSSSYSNAMKGIPGAFIQKSEINMAEGFKDVSLPVDHGSNSDASMNLHGVQVSSNGSGEPESSWGGQEEIACAVVNSSSKGLGAKKRRRNTQDMELGRLEGTQQFSIDDSKEIIATAATPKPSGKAKDCSDATKEDYVHVRARRGQATNSHSLAERLRREKISERMKYLQDLVPGCSKVTGKAVMLDEIINYVQSLQRQVELLSMKLAAVNPSLEFNIDGLLSKNFLQSWGSCSPIGFSNDIMHSQLHPPQQGFVQAGMNGITNHSGALGRVMNAQIAIISGNKEPTPQTHNAWDDELHNIIQMNLGTANPPLNTPELKGRLRDGFPS